jgi:uncharacterized membrane protein
MLNLNSDMAKKKPTLSIDKLFKDAWNIFKDKWQFILGLGVLLFIIQMVVGGVQNAFEDSALYFLVMLAAWVVNLVIQMGFLKVYIKLAKKKTAQIADLWSFSPDHVWNYLLGTMLYGVIVFLGFILLIIPGIYLMLKYMFVPYVLVTKKVGPMKALAMSAQMTDGQKFSLLGLAVSAVVLNFLGVLALGIGLIITLPVTYLSYALAYNTLESKAK